MDLMNLTNIHIQHSTSESLEEKPRLQEITYEVTLFSFVARMSME